MRLALLLVFMLSACSTTKPVVVFAPMLSSEPELSAEPEPELSAEPAPKPEPARQALPRVASPSTSTAVRAVGDETAAQVMTKIAGLCAEIGRKLSSVSAADCQRQALQHTAVSVLNRPIAYRDYAPAEPGNQQGRVLLIGGIHGDEFSSVSVVFKWMDLLSQQAPWPLLLRVVPLANPDGLLRTKSQRQNENGVDLNRNFPTTDWASHARDYWVETTSKNIRRYPGETSASEPETRWLVDQIREFAPNVIIALHAPHHLVDYDGPPSAPQQVGKLNLRQLGVYPGSLGNYAGQDLQIPVVTLELQSAGIMPADAEIRSMLKDLQQWLHVQLSQQAVNSGQPSAPNSATSR